MDSVRERRKMTNEEYRKELTRYWDSIRDKGGSMMGECICDGIKCDDCILCKLCTASISFAFSNAFEAIELVEQWSKEHPIKTNGQVAKELLEEKFGIKFIDFCSCKMIDCDQGNGEYENCDDCIYRHFWEQEYKER